jgi:hypothetical protein
MECAQTLSDKTESLTLDQSIAFLEPSTTRGGAMCMSTEDFAALKTALEQACNKLGRACTKEAKQNLKVVSARMDRFLKARKK